MKYQCQGALLCHSCESHYIMIFWRFFSFIAKLSYKLPSTINFWKRKIGKYFLCMVFSDVCAVGIRPRYGWFLLWSKHSLPAYLLILWSQEHRPPTYCSEMIFLCWLNAFCPLLTLFISFKFVCQHTNIEQTMTPMDCHFVREVLGKIKMLARDMKSRKWGRRTQIENLFLPSVGLIFSENNLP